MIPLDLRIFVLVATVLVGCGDPPPTKYPVQEIAVADTTLGAGDLFEVRVYRQDELTGSYEVSPECTITFPLLGPVVICGKSGPEIGRDIQLGLAEGFLKNPQVSVRVTEYRSKKVSVFGQVKKVGTLPYIAGMTVIEAISEAGGFTEMARKNAVMVTRSIDGAKTNYTIPVDSIGKGTAENFIIRPGDVVYVPRRFI